MKLTNKFFALFKRDAVLFFANLLTGIVVARELGPELMGIWTILLLIPGYIEAAGRTQYDISAVYFVGKKKANLEEIAFILHLTAAASTVLAGTVFFSNFDWFYGQLFTNIEENVRIYAAAIFFIFPLRLIYLNYSYLLIAQEDIKSYNTLVVAQALSTALLSIFLIMGLDFGISGAVAGSLIGVLVAIFYAGTITKSYTGASLIFNSSLFLEMGKYASNYYLNTIIGYFQQNVTSLICALFLAPSQVAFYALGKSMCDVSTRMVPTAINTALFPHVTRLENESESASLVARLFRITLLILAGTSVVLAITIAPLVNVLYGSAYLPIIVPFLIIIPGVVLSQAATIFSQFFSGMGRPDLLPKAAIFPLGLQILLSITLVPEYGVRGAAVSYSASATCLFCFQMVLFLRLSGLNMTGLMPVHDDIRSIWSACLDQLLLYRNRVDRWRRD